MVVWQYYQRTLMCFICSPAQSIFYKNESLNVCTEYCDRYYDACKGEQQHTLFSRCMAIILPPYALGTLSKQAGTHCGVPQTPTKASTRSASCIPPGLTSVQSWNTLSPTMTATLRIQQPNPSSRLQVCPHCPLCGVLCSFFCGFWWIDLS